MSKAADRAARERKQKIFVAVGGLALVGILAIQAPKLMGSSSEAASPPATSPATAQPGAPTGTPVAASGGGGLPVVAQAELRSFSLFGRKDPFVQKVVTATVASSSASSEAPAKSSEPKEASESAPTKGFTIEGKQAAAVTVIAVNGARQALETGGVFPEADPVFVLIAEQPKAKSVTIGIAGGAYANGSKTTTLKVGKPIVLENTTTGARYRIVLVSVGSGSPSSTTAPSSAKQPDSEAAPSP
jgi:hypothetical protein